MKKKLLAIVMSASMVLSFMPSIAFAAETSTETAPPAAPAETATYDVAHADCWSYTPGQKTAKLVKVYKTEKGATTTVDCDVAATVEYKDDKDADAWKCGETVTVKKTVFTTKSNVFGQVRTWTNDETTDIAFPEHDYKTVAAKAATCEANGNYAYKVCKTCGYYEIEKPDAKTEAGKLETGYESPSEMAKTKANIAAKQHTVTLATNQAYWIKTGDKVKLSVLAELKCDTCGQTFVIDHNEKDTIKTPYKKNDADVEADVKTDDALAAPAKDCTVAGAVTARSAAIVVDGGDVTVKGTATRPSKDVTVKYVEKTAGEANAKHTFGTSCKFDWNKDYSKCTYKMNKCENCETYEKELPCEITKKTTASCTTNGSTVYTASVKLTPESKAITDRKTVTEKKSGHDYKFVDKKEATCTADGWEAHYECSNGCDNWFKKTDDGRYVVVSKSQYKIAKGHQWTGDYTLPKKNVLASEFFGDNHTITSKASVKNVVCSKCGIGHEDMTNLDIKVNGKEYNKLNEGKNSCVDGIILPVEVVGTGIKTNVTLDARKHSDNNASSEITFVWDTKDPDNATCNVKFFGCTNHDVVCSNPNAVGVDYTFKAVDKACGVATVSQPATVEKTVTTAPTCTKTGEATYKASYKYSTTGIIYTDSKKVVLPKVDHKATVIEAVAPTVFTEGKTAGVKCANCGEILEAPKAVAKAKYAAPTVKAGKKLATVTVKSTKGAVKYQISYKKAGGKYVTKTVKAGKKVTIKKLAKGKKYTFKAVAINADGVKATSAVKTVKIK